MRIETTKSGKDKKTTIYDRADRKLFGAAAAAPNALVRNRGRQLILLLQPLKDKRILVVTYDDWDGGL